MVDVTEMTRVGGLREAEIEEADELEELGQEARRYLMHHWWCEEVREGFFDRGFSKFAVFYFRIRPHRDSQADEDVWVIVGDCPPAYMDTYSCSNGASAAEAYVLNMENWADAVLADEPIDELYPVCTRGSFRRLGPDKELARGLRSRMEFVRRNLLADWTDELGEGTTEP